MFDDRSRRELITRDISSYYIDYASDILVSLFTKIKILVVVDSSIDLDLDTDSFGIGRVIKLIRETTFGTVDFEVTIARRQGNTGTTPNPSDTEPKYSGFRFDQKEPDGKNTIDNFTEIWCFGFEPGNNPGGTDNDIVSISSSELKELTKWMNDKKGGIFATGDHHYLGADMCSKIPRVRTMRKWTIADGVPPISGPDRIDTNRPANSAQADITGTPQVMQNTNERDSNPQKIDWIPWITSLSSAVSVAKRPHPILCHPSLGPIDIMPDHPHEGLCFDTRPDRDGNVEIKLDGSYDFNGYAGQEYPQDGSIRPTPQIIAEGTTLPDPPYSFQKGDSPAKRFPMISVYDGMKTDVGRVVVDSTWHHWLNMNISEMESETDQTNWEKISRYYINIALWLSPKRPFSITNLYFMIASSFSYLGFREFSPKGNIYEMGNTYRTTFSRRYGPCWVDEFILDWFRVYKKELYPKLIDHYIKSPKPFPAPNPCLSCPPFDLIEDAMLGGMIKKSSQIITPIIKQLNKNQKCDDVLDIEKFQNALNEGINEGLEELKKSIEESIKYTRNMFDDSCNASKS